MEPLFMPKLGGSTLHVILPYICESSIHVNVAISIKIKQIENKTSVQDIKLELSEVSTYLGIPEAFLKLIPCQESILFTSK